MNDILDFIRSAAPWVAMGLAVAILAVRGAVPEGLKLYRFPESDWAVFSARGPLPGSLQTLNTYVWQTWYPAEGQQVVGNGAAALLGLL